MSSVATTPRRMETFARALDRAVASAIVPRARIEQLRSAFIATDAQGRSWTIDPEFQRWGRLDGELWMVDDPPPELLMDSEMRASLEELEAMAARAIVKGADALRPTTPWFRTPGAHAELPGMQAAPSGLEPILTVTPTPAPSVVSHVTAQAATPVEQAVPSRSAIPEAHRRFAGPGIAPNAPDRVPVSAGLPAPPPRDASHDHERRVPTSIAPRLTAEHPEARDLRVLVFLCGLIGALFLALSFLKGDGGGYVPALLFGVLTVTLLVFNLTKSRNE